MIASKKLDLPTNLPDIGPINLSFEDVPVAAASAQLAPSVGKQQVANIAQSTTTTPPPTVDPAPTPTPTATTTQKWVDPAVTAANARNKSMNDYSAAMSALINQIDLKTGANEAAKIQGDLKAEQEDFARWGLGESNRQADAQFAQADKSKGMADANSQALAAKAAEMLGAQQSSFDTYGADRRAALGAGLAEQRAMSDNSLSSRNNAIDQLAVAMGRGTDGMFQQNLKSIGSGNANIRNMINELGGSRAMAGMEQDLLEGQQAIDTRGQDFDFQVLAMERNAQETYQQQRQMAQAMANAGLINFDSAMAQIESNYIQAMKQVEQMKVEADNAKSQMVLSALETLFNMSQIS